MRHTGLLALLLLAAGCATTGATIGSGVGDAWLEEPPYYAGRWPRAEEQGQPLAHLPIAYQRGATNPESFDPAPTGALAELLVRMNAYLDSLSVSRRIEAPHGARRLVGPDVRFGCPTEGGVPGGDCVERDDEAVLGRHPERMVLAVGRPSPEWVAWAGAAMADAGARSALVITLEVGQYWTRQRGWRGDKEVALGTSHVQSLPWLTSLETPVSVLQLTGAVVGADGRAIRIGAEGLLARRTRLLVSVLGAEELISDDDVERVLTARRDDLAGQPLVWQVALRELVEGLTGR